MIRPSSLPGFVRRPLNAFINGAWEWIAEAAATGPGTPRGKRYGRLGKSTFIAFPTGAVYGERWMHIGADTIIGPYVTMSCGMLPGQEMVTDPVLRIGDRVNIGRGSCIVAHFEVEIGDDVTTGPYVYITDQNHTYERLDEPIGLQWPVEQPVRVGAGSWLGTGTVILPGARIGEHVVVAAGSVVRGDVPDRCVVGGIPARILRRHVEGLGWVSADHPAAAG